MSELERLFQRLVRLEKELSEGLGKRAAEDEGTKILQAADNLELSGEERARRRELVRRVKGLLDAPSLLAITDGHCAVDAVEDLLVAGQHLVTELEWVAKLTLQAIANDEALRRGIMSRLIPYLYSKRWACHLPCKHHLLNTLGHDIATRARVVQDAYLFSIIPRMHELEELHMVRKLGAWAQRSVPISRRMELVQKIEHLEVRMSSAMESLNAPAQSEAGLIWRLGPCAGLSTEGLRGLLGVVEVRGSEPGLGGTGAVAPGAQGGEERHRLLEGPLGLLEIQAPRPIFDIF